MLLLGINPRTLDIGGGEVLGLAVTPDSRVSAGPMRYCAV